MKFLRLLKCASVAGRCLRPPMAVAEAQISILKSCSPALAAVLNEPGEDDMLELETTGDTARCPPATCRFFSASAAGSITQFITF
ncbi:hypothetical protein EYF80_027455 [Liparis tanakae]|uniref:Uncharacterized protein n=1 Tax=Liparis tanakae TaxID=230148 RepID=A0A4Z2H8Y4_9TELE|nr:hypothetical protein EYF80_027455 [Liparis tanakae]